MGVGEEKPKTTESLSMRSFGSLEQELLGEIFLLIMAIGKTPTDGFAGGETRGFGNLCLKNSSPTLTMNGWWSTPRISKSILTQAAPKAAIKIWAVQKGAQYQGTLGRGCAWYAGPNAYYRRYHSWLHTSFNSHWRNHSIADKAYDTDDILNQCTLQGIESVIPPKKNRKVQRAFDKDLYKYRHLVENAFLHLKRWRGIATRYAKNTASFLAAVHIRCLVLWLNISWRHYLSRELSR